MSNMEKRKLEEKTTKKLQELKLKELNCIDEFLKKAKPHSEKVREIDKILNERERKYGKDYLYI